MASLTNLLGGVWPTFQVHFAVSKTLNYWKSVVS